MQRVLLSMMLGIAILMCGCARDTAKTEKCESCEASAVMKPTTKPAK